MQTPREVLASASPGGFKIATQALPLAQVERGWATEGARVVFTM
jgi:hypothetical protein